MTPDKRLDQIEPILADVVQKTDRLIESNGQILEIATRADSNAKIAAKGVADLTIEMRQRFDQVDQRFEQQQIQMDQLSERQIELNKKTDVLTEGQIELNKKTDQLTIGQIELNQKTEQLTEGQVALHQKTDRLAIGQDELRQEIQKINQKFTQVEQTQQQILTILLDRLK